MIQCPPPHRLAPAGACSAPGWPRAPGPSHPEALAEARRTTRYNAASRAKAPDFKENYSQSNCSKSQLRHQILVSNNAHKRNQYCTDATVNQLHLHKLADKRRKAFNIIPMEDMQSHAPKFLYPKNNTDRPTALKKASHQGKVPEVYDFESQGSQVYSELIASLPVEDIQHPFTKQPQEIHFGGSDIQHYLNPIYEYTETTEEHLPLQIPKC